MKRDYKITMESFRKGGARYLRTETARWNVKVGRREIIWTGDDSPISGYPEDSDTYQQLEAEYQQLGKGDES